MNAAPRLIGTTPADPADRGDADPALSIALASGDVVGALQRVLLARLLLPVVAAPATDSAAEMAVPALVDGAGGRALPAFTSLAALRRWRSDARPVPMPGVRVVAGAAAEGYAAVLIDIAGPHPLQLTGSVFTKLAAAASEVLGSEGPPGC